MKPIAATPEDLKTSKLVTSMQVDPALSKGTGYRGTCFLHKVTLVLSDGSEVPWNIQSDKKKNLPAAIEREQRAITAKAMKYDASGMVSSTWAMF